VRRAHELLALVVVLAAVAAVPIAAAGPIDPKAMVLVPSDLGKGAAVTTQGATTTGEIPARAGYRREFTGVSLGNAHVFTVQDTALVGKSASAASGLVSSILLITSSKNGQKTLYNETKGSFASSAQTTVTSGAITRARDLHVGDSSVEVTFRFNTPKGSFQVGEIWIAVGRVLSAVYLGAGQPGVSAASVSSIARAVAAHMQSGGA
jgi:hypothetical protein